MIDATVAPPDTAVISCSQDICPHSNSVWPSGDTQTVAEFFCAKKLIHYTIPS